MRVLLLALSVLAAATAQHHHHGGHPDPFAGSGCNCTSFCAGSCAINATGKSNMTLYRMTQFGVDDMHNKNTGDIAGDTSFVISRRTTAYDCRKNPSSFMCSGLAQFTGDNPDSTDLVLQWTIEVDGNWGPYLMCNPTVTKNPLGDWECSTSLPHAGPSPPPGPPAPPPPPAPPLPPQCKDFKGFAGCVKGYKSGETKVASIADCCAAASVPGGRFKRSAQAFTYFANNGSCVEYAFAMGAAHCPDGVSAAATGGGGGGGGSQCNCARANKTVGREVLELAYAGSTSMHPAGGIWYSHPQNGQCTDGQYVGDGSGCTWRAVELTRAINASCLYRHLDENVEKSGGTCFNTCTKPLNMTSDCYLKCYTETIDTMSHLEIAAPWGKAFAGADKTVGGCPVVHKIKEY